MSKFKVGDKVRCVDVYYHERLVEGVTYTVKRIEKLASSDLLSLEGVIGGHYAHRFELVSEFKPGDRVAVAFEDVITSVSSDTAFFKDGLATLAAPLSSLTKLTDPIPTADGAVIRIDSFDPQVFERDVANGWWATGSDLAYRVEEVQELVNAQGGFTVLYAGEEEN